MLRFVLSRRFIFLEAEFYSSTCMNFSGIKLSKLYSGGCVAGSYSRKPVNSMTLTILTFGVSLSKVSLLSTKYVLPLN